MAKKLIGVLLLLVFFLVSCGGNKTDVSTGATWEEGMDSEPSLPVEAVEITRGILVPYVEANGVVSGIREAFVVSETQGIIKAVNFEIGDSIKAGAPMLQVSDTVARLNMEQARQQYDNARVDLEAAERFFRQGSASQTELSRARAAFNGARAVFEAAQKAFEDTTLKAPISGSVAWKDPVAAEGNLVSPGTRAARIVDMQELRISLSVGERQVGLIELGAEAAVTIPSACNIGPVYGKVSAIASGSDLSTGSFTVIVTAPNPCFETIKAGMSAQVRITARENNPGLIVPTSSIVTREGGEYLFVAENGRARAVPLSGKSVSGNRTSITGDVQEGEYVVISGLSVLRPGRGVSATVVGKSGEWK